MPSQVSDNIGRSVRQIRDHIMSVSKVEIKGGIFYFKIDRKTDVLMLFMVSNLEIEDEKKEANTVCLGSKYSISLNAVIKASHEPDKSLKQSHETIELPNIEIVGKRLSHHYELPQIKEQAATA